MTSYLPPWAAPEAKAAVGDLVAYVETMNLGEVFSSLRCVNLQVSLTALNLKRMTPTTRARGEQHVAMTLTVQRVLLDRAAALHQGLEEVHDHCPGFFQTLDGIEARIVAASGGGT